jgi:hypothetical protein
MLRVSVAHLIMRWNSPLTFSPRSLRTRQTSKKLGFKLINGDMWPRACNGSLGQVNSPRLETRVLHEGADHLNGMSALHLYLQRYRQRMFTLLVKALGESCFAMLAELLW